MMVSIPDDSEFDLRRAMTIWGKLKLAVFSIFAQ
jgi:hypothetical protein